MGDGGDGPVRIDAPDVLDSLDFGKLDGLVPVVAQDASTREVLMVAFADREALERTLETGEMHYRSRSRDALWRKGETSGNVQRVRALIADCDADTVLALVEPAGPACHTGSRTCFGDRPPMTGGPFLARLAEIVEARAEGRPEGSYTVRLLDDENLRIKKIGEETAELVAALGRQDADDAREEAADLLYHLLVALVGAGVGLDEVEAVLRSRHAADGEE